MIIFLMQVWFNHWSNFYINEMLLTYKNTSIIFPGTYPIEYEELYNFYNSIDLQLKDRINLLNYERQNIYFEIRGDTNTCAYGLIGLGAKKTIPLLKFSTTVFLEIIGKIGKGFEYPQKLWQNTIAADYFNGYVKINIANFILSLGRESIKWGPSTRSSLLISGEAPNFDILRFSYRNNRFKFSYFFTQLDPIEGTRFLSGHRLEIIPKKGIYLGLAETALFGKDIELFYLNPLFLYYPQQWNRKYSDANILWSVDLNTFFNPDALKGIGIGVYLEFLIDDFPYQVSERKQTPKIGINLGTRIGWFNNYIICEYTAITRWTYNHRINWQRYTFIEYSIGHPIGPDFDEIFLGVVHHLNKKTDLIFEFSHIRKGEATIYEQEPYIFPKEYFLTGKIKYYNKICFGIKSYKFNKFRTICEAGIILGEKNSKTLSLSISSI